MTAVGVPTRPRRRTAAPNPTGDGGSGTVRQVARLAVLVTVLLTLGAALLALSLGLGLGGGAPRPAPVGLPDPGRLVAWGLVATRAASQLAAVLTVGSLLVAAVLDPRPVRGTQHVAALAAGSWGLCTAARWVLTACDTAGTGVGSLDARVLLLPGPGGRVAATGVVALCVAIVAVLALRTRSASGARGLLVVALAAAVALPVLGHAGSTTDGGVAVSGLAVHVVAALLWAGGLTGLLLHLRLDGAGLALAAPRFSALALVAYVTLAVSGLLAATAVLPFSGPGLAQAWTSGYAGVVLAKAALLVVLGVVGHRHRRRTLPRLAAGQRGAFVRLAGVEVVLMAAAVGLATALALTPSPVETLDGAAAHGEDTPGPLSLTGLVTVWRPNAVVVVVLLLALVIYHRGVRRLMVTGVVWSGRRTASFTAGLAVAFLVACSGVTLWAPLLLSVHLAQLMVALLVVPLLVLLGHPSVLVGGQDRRPSPGTLQRVLADPVTGVAATCALLVGLLRTPAIELSLRHPALHLLVLALAAGCGMVLLRSTLVIGASSGSRGPAERAGSLLVVASCLGVLALQLGLGDRMLAGAWFAELRLGWADPMEDQRLAGLLVAGAAVGVAALAVVAVALGRRSSIGSSEQ